MSRTITITLPTIDEVEFSIECEDEDIPVRGNAISSGDDKHDRECEDEIIADYESGNYWAWCCVHVTAKWKSLEGDDYLGCCSYKSEEDFIRTSGYYDDMKQAAYNELIEKLTSLTK